METGSKELHDLIEIIQKEYGYDFSGYSMASFSRRVNRFLSMNGLESIQELKKILSIDHSGFETFLQEITVNVTELYRDPLFFRSLREKVVPTLKTYPINKIWDAGCSTGEEAYSLAILLQEENLYNKSKIYATDINPKVLQRASDGVFPLPEMKQYTANYFQAGGTGSLSDYYFIHHNQAIFNNSLKRNIIFAAHNLATDTSFNEFNLILCRNVLIYFKKELQEKVIQLFLDSLVIFGYLALGTKESLPYLFHDKFEVVDQKEKIFRKIRN